MKKKARTEKKTEMPEFQFKEFTAEENKIYEEAVNAYREAITAGKNLREAYESYPIVEAALASLIQADFLKILIAERHFAQQQTLEEIAAALGISSDLIKDTYKRMLQEVGVSAASQFGHEFGGAIPKADD